MTSGRPKYNWQYSDYEDRRDVLYTGGPSVLSIYSSTTGGFPVAKGPEVRRLWASRFTASV